MSNDDRAGASAEAIRHHYDVSNDFYRLWLDESMTYTCALFAGDDDTLEKAQQRKLDRHVAEACCRGAARVLDIGCGWGSLLSRLVDEHGVGEAVGLTLSAAQAEHVARLGRPRVRVLVEDWAAHNAEPYDAIISIGAFEAFAHPGMTDEDRSSAYQKFFAACHRLLKPGARLSLQTIAVGSTPQKRSMLKDLRFIYREIFPESALPALADIAAAIQGWFEIVALRNDRADYVRTLREWLRRLRERRAAAIDHTSPEIVARYERYLDVCARTFEMDACHLYRITLRAVNRS
jgi:cyclopropane-fatty-acyl-phospholipid synthase